MNDEGSAYETKQKHHHCQSEDKTKDQDEDEQDDYNLKRKPNIATHDEYRQILSTANKLEAIQSKLDSVIELFGTPAVTNLFSKLCNECLNLVLKCEFKLVEFRKAEELVWRRVYHDVYRLLKTKRQPMRKDDEFLIESHFMSGICFYSSLIVQLRLKFSITNVHNVINPLNLALVPVDGLLDSPKQSYIQAIANRRDPNQSSTQIVDGSPNEIIGPDDIRDCNGINATARQWARQSIYRSLIYMGDIARYLLEFSDCDHRLLAYELYRSAARYQPDYGLPFNQLATLAGGVNYNLDAVCNYMRCCLRPKPFERAEGNMVKIFEFNKKLHDDLSIGHCVMKVADVIASKDPAKEAEYLVRTTIVTFLKLSSQLWFAIGDDLSNDVQNAVVNDTQRFFEILREAIELDPIMPFAETSCMDAEFRPTPGGPCSSDKARYVTSTIMYEFCSIAIMLIARRRRQPTPYGVSKILISTGSNINDNINDLVNTLALNLLHYATSKCQKMIISKIQELRFALQDTSLETNQIIKLSSNSGPRNSSPVSSDAASRKVLSRLRLKKAATNYSTGIIKHRLSITRDDASEMSELEETALSTIDALEISSEMSEGADCREDDLIDLDSNSDDGALMKSSASLELLSRPKLRPTRSLNYEYNKKCKLTVNETSNPSPAPDLLTGDLADISYKTSVSLYQDILDTPSELDSEQIVNTAQSTIESTLTYVYNQTYLPTMKVFFDWLLSDFAIVDSNLESFTAYHKELLNTVNLLVELKRLLDMNDKETDSDIYRHTFTGPEWIQRFPMSCDFPFTNLSPMKNVHDSNIDFGIQRELTNAESGFITIECVLGFSHALTIFLENKAQFN